MNSIQIGQLARATQQQLAGKSEVDQIGLILDAMVKVRDELSQGNSQPQALEVLLHEMWGDAKGGTTYNKAKWMQLQSAIATERARAAAAVDGWQKSRVIADECRTRADSLQRECDDYNYMGNLLAIIHGDGGHYMAAHGTEKATDDAIEIVSQLKQRAEAAEEANRLLLEQIQTMKQTTKMTKEFIAGMEHAIRTISAFNPEARSASAEIRGECQREIWKEIDRMAVEVGPVSSDETCEQQVRLAANRCLEFVAVGKNNHSVPVEVSFQQIIRECVKRAVANE